MLAWLCRFSSLKWNLSDEKLHHSTFRVLLGELPCRRIFRLSFIFETYPTPWLRNERRIKGKSLPFGSTSHPHLHLPVPTHLGVSRRIASRRIASRRIASHRIASHRIASHRIASRRLSYWLFWSGGATLSGLASGSEIYDSAPSVYIPSVAAWWPVAAAVVAPARRHKRNTLLRLSLWCTERCAVENLEDVFSIYLEFQSGKAWS